MGEFEPLAPSCGSRDCPGKGRTCFPGPCAMYEARKAKAAELNEKLSAAVKAYEALSPVDRALHDADQRRSFVRGQSGRDPGPDVLAEEVRRLRALLTLARSAPSAELVKLGEAAVKLERAIQTSFGTPWNERQDLLKAARTYANSVVGK